MKEKTLSEKMVSGVKAWRITQDELGKSLPCFFISNDVKEAVEKLNKLIDEDEIISKEMVNKIFGSFE